MPLEFTHRQIAWLAQMIFHQFRFLRRSSTPQAGLISQKYPYRLLHFCSLFCLSSGTMNIAWLQDSTDWCTSVSLLSVHHAALPFLFQSLWILDHLNRGTEKKRKRKIMTSKKDRIAKYGKFYNDNVQLLYSKLFHVELEMFLSHIP